MKVKDISELLNSWAPYDTAEEFDNVGLLVGNAEDTVSGVLIALDATVEVISEAKNVGANLIVTHHPVIFDPMKDITPESPQGRAVRLLVKNEISVICVHTNLDAAKGGVGDALAEALELKRVKNVPECAYMRLGELERKMDPNEFAGYVSQKTGSKSILSAGPAPAGIKTVCVMGGSGGSYLDDAIKTGADVFLTGSAKHEHATAAENMAAYMMTAGHYETEAMVLPKIRAYLQKHADDVQSINGFNIAKSSKTPFNIMV